uniref:Protein JTB n=1 Tax=Anolis carolinensis TaxID=28377 RepID=A0A803TQG9_ANOCA
MTGKEIPPAIRKNFLTVRRAVQQWNSLSLVGAGWPSVGGALIVLFLHDFSFNGNQRLARTTVSSCLQKTMPECGATGFVEQINCSASKKGEFKSCRSAAMESRLFWRFEGAMLGAAASFALLVVCRQRLLDRKALEKVRKQIESI